MKIRSGGALLEERLQRIEAISKVLGRRDGQFDLETTLRYAEARAPSLVARHRISAFGFAFTA